MRCVNFSKEPLRDLLLLEQNLGSHGMSCCSARMALPWARILVLLTDPKLRKYSSSSDAHLGSRPLEPHICQTKRFCKSVEIEVEVGVWGWQSFGKQIIVVETPNFSRRVLGHRKLCGTTRLGVG